MKSNNGYFDKLTNGYIYIYFTQLVFFFSQKL